MRRDVTAAPGAAIEDTGAEPVIETGDGDPFVDNCEIARLTFNVVNTGGVTLTNVRVTAIAPSNPKTQVLTPLPIAVPNLRRRLRRRRTPPRRSPSASAPAAWRRSRTLTFQVTVDGRPAPRAR